MKIKLLLTIFCTISFLGCKQTNEQANSKSGVIQSHTKNNLDSIRINDFIGYWESNDDSDNHTFSIEFFKNPSGKLEGQYCAVARQGNKIDCSTDKEMNINFLRKENESVVVSFESFFGAKNGEATIKISGGQLIWEVVKKPKGAFYYPPKATLIKKNDSDSGNLETAVNVTSDNYKQNDITMQLYKTIIDVNGCGENVV